MKKIRLTTALCAGILSLTSLSACASDEPGKIGSRDDIIVNNRGAMPAPATASAMAPMVEEGEEVITSETPIESDIESTAQETLESTVVSEDQTTDVMPAETPAVTEVKEAVKDKAEVDVPEVPVAPQAPTADVTTLDMKEPEMTAPEVAKPEMAVPRAPEVTTPTVENTVAPSQTTVEEVEGVYVRREPVQTEAGEAQSVSNIVSEDQTVDTNPPVKPVVTEDQTVDAPSEKVYVSPYVDTRR